MSRIFIVEDDDLLRESLRVLYELEGHEVFEAANGADAIRFFEQAASRGHVFDIALLDYNLPHYKGDTVAHEMRKSAERYGVPLPRLIALTGSKDSKVLGRLEEQGVYEVVIKAGREFRDFDALKRRIGVTVGA